MKLAEANAWFRRNRDRLGADDPVSDMIARNNIEPKRVLEIGCANGWRLAKLCRKYDCRGAGIDASSEAIEDGKKQFAEIDMMLLQGVFPYAVQQGNLPLIFESRADVIICGFFLYLADRDDLFPIVSEIDGILMDGGWLIIHDFCAGSSYSNPYAHDSDMRCYKQDYSRLFTGNPAYRVMCQSMTGVGDDCVAVHLLRKDVKRGWPPKDGVI